MFLPSHLVTSITYSLSQLPGMEATMTTLKANISPHTRLWVSYSTGTTAAPNASFSSTAGQASPLGTSFSVQLMSNCPSISLPLVNCISYHSQRMLHTLSVTNLSPNFILIYQWSSKGSKIQDDWYTGLTSIPPKSYIHSAPGKCEIWKYGLCRCNQIKMRSY